MSLKIVNLGLPKSGTTTLGEALKAAGLSVADWKIRPGQAKLRGFVGKLMYDGYFDGGDPLALMPDFDAYSEIDIVRNGLNLWPQCDFGLLDAIRKHHPGARFILTHREPYALADSMRRWSNLGTRRLPKHAIPGLPEGYGDTTKQRVQWAEGHYEALTQFFENDPNFLEFTIADPDARVKISAFLGRELPWWGHLNANPIREQLESG